MGLCGKAPDNFDFCVNIASASLFKINRRRLTLEIQSYFASATRIILDLYRSKVDQETHAFLIPMLKDIERSRIQLSVSDNSKTISQFWKVSKKWI